nr:immunoglobulin heavy chain junction region [Macaca mulatta]MOY21789.1 immunoglobulin heavy chain junction region [Macaca mulatta]MOY22569.1 immunoglobulin heavy chain junction region [Macaca mulatta]MOY23151.1 immunoglobulin heavy chain junction region [Macaca mulatta]MOY26455.1 immunoglobulin heavy chain junction region [Macaca mulatta]
CARDLDDVLDLW